ncbi:DUF1800 family protein [Granulosicoccus sp. 3-233]|uniref:DUF1800 family protein n=1 Tax=Granulosicoccus sp. 3-233 TaxID=3417969 RepID=UPI003D34B291
MPRLARKPHVAMPSKGLRGSLRKGYLAAAVLLSCLLSPAFATTYSDAESGVGDWQVYDQSPAGAEIVTEYDDILESQVIETRGVGRNNGYLLGGTSAENGWNNTSEFHANWRMQVTEAYTLYIRIDTSDGWRYLTYSNSNSDALANSTGQYIRYGLGSSSTDGTWRVFSRDLASDLTNAQPENTLLAVNGFLVRGSMRLDDITLATEAVNQTVLPPVSSVVDATAEDGSTAGWKIFDNSPAGATIAVVSDELSGSLVYETTGAGRSNGYQLGGLDTVDGWNNQSEFQLDWDMRVSENYQVYVRVDTANGWRYLVYSNSNSDSLLASNGRNIGFGLGSTSKDGQWHTFSRDLAADLEIGEPGNTLIAVHGLLIRGSLRLDNIRLSAADDVEAIAPEARIAGGDQVLLIGDIVELDGSGSTDDSAVAAYQWTDESGTVLGSDPVLSVSAESAGLFTYQLTVTDDEGLSDSATTTLTVQDGSVATIYEDGEDSSTSRWRIADASPSGATVENIVDADQGSRVIELSGTDQQNSFVIGHHNSQAPGWNNFHQTHLRWSMQTDGGFSVYVQLETADGLRYLIYDQYSTDRGSDSASSLRFGLGSGAHDGHWQTFTRNVYEDLATFQPDNALIAVHGVQFRGSFRVDDIQMFIATDGGGGDEGPVYEDAEDSSIARWRITDTTPGGAVVANVQDNERNSRVIELSGNGQANAYLIGNTDSRGAGWNNTEQSHLRWSMKTDAGFSVNVPVETTQGFRYLIYDQYNGNRGNSSSSNLRYGLGSSAHDNTWQTFTRNVRQDLAALQPDNELIAVHGVQFRGDFRVDDIRMLTVTDALPLAALSASPLEGDGPLLASFDASESSDDNGIVSYSFDFGDGSEPVSGEQDEASHVYPLAGSYTAVVTVTDTAGQQSSDQVTIQVLDDSQAPTANLVASVSEGEAPLTTVFDASGSSDNQAIVSYAWDFGDGAVQQGEDLVSISHEYTEAGEYTARVTVSDANGNQSSASLVITVESEPVDEPPVAAFTVASPIEGSTVSFVNDSTDDGQIASVLWNFGDATETGQSDQHNPSYSYSSVGDYTVTLTVVDDAGQMDTATQVITITELDDEGEPLLASVTASAVSGEAPFDVTLDASGSSGGQGDLSYQWLVSRLDQSGEPLAEDSISATGISVETQLTVAGEYAVTLTVRDELEAESVATLMLTVNAADPNNGVTPEDAARLLAQATFGPSSESIARVQTLGLEGWIDEQLSLPMGAPHLDFVRAHSNGSRQEPRHEVWWRDVVNGEDQLRQRVAFALSQIFVVSDQGYTLGNAQYGVTHYYDQLQEGAFGNYRDLLETVTLSPVMGVYLSMLQNQRGEMQGNTRADENFAREVLQLFSIGLYELNIDGTQKKSGGKPIHTYTQEQIEEYSRVFTGWNFGGATDWTLAAINSRADKIAPMQAWPEYHDNGAKALLGGVTLAAGQSAELDLQMALDTIAGHANVAPFMSKQLIQRMVTSNPTPAYVARVSRVFNDNGQGERGDLGAVVKAILLDEEARSGHLNIKDFGKLREPILRLSHLWRAFNVSVGSQSVNGVYNTASPHLKDLDSVGGQAVLKSPSVFNFFHPDYAPLGPIYSSGKVAPEAEIYTEDKILLMTNRIDRQIQYEHDDGDSNARKSSYIDLSRERALAAVSTDALLDRLDLLLLSGSMSDGLRDILSNHLESLPSADTREGQSRRVRDALSLIMASPDYLVQM